MAQNMTTENPTKSAEAAAPSLSSERVVEAVLHFARLGASHTQFGVTFTDGFVADEADEESRKALADATRILLKDRDRMRAKMADALTARVHTIVADTFRAAQRSPEVEQEVEDLIERRLREQLGFTLSADQKRHLTIDCQYIKKHKGPSNAAADAIGKGFGLETGRSVFDAVEDANERSPVPGPLNRFVPLRDVRVFLDRVLAFAEATRRSAPTLPLDALRSNEHAEALMDRVERCFREETRSSLDGAKGELTDTFRALMRGEALGKPLPAELEAFWAPVRARFIDLRARVAELDAQIAALAPGVLGPSVGLIDLIADLMADAWTATIKQSLDVA